MVVMSVMKNMKSSRKGRVAIIIEINVSIILDKDSIRSSNEKHLKS